MPVTRPINGTLCVLAAKVRFSFVVQHKHSSPNVVRPITIAAPYFGNKTMSPKTILDAGTRRAVIDVDFCKVMFNYSCSIQQIQSARGHSVICLDGNSVSPYPRINVPGKTSPFTMFSGTYHNRSPFGIGPICSSIRS